MIKIFCDICGKEIADPSQIEYYKIKRMERGFFPDIFWERLTVHKDCWRDLSKIIDERRKK